MNYLTMVKREQKLMDRYLKQMSDIRERLDYAGRYGTVEKMLMKRYRRISNKVITTSNKHLTLGLNRY